VNSNVFTALTGYFPYLIPEAILIGWACVLFLGGTWRAGRNVWGTAALLGILAAGLAVWGSVGWVPTMEAERDRIAHMDPGAARDAALETARTFVYASPILHTHLALLIKTIALLGAAILVLFSWNEVPDKHAADYHACLLLITAGVCFTGAANDLITLFLALELISIPTYVLLYLPRVDDAAQEAAMKYFMLSVFSSALMLFGFSYLYGLAGTTNLSALTEAFLNARSSRAEAELPGVALLALVMVMAGLGFKITAVPFHFYAPDVYQGTATGAAALLAFVPKVAGFTALIHVLGYVPSALVGLEFPLGRPGTTQALGRQVPVLLWIMAAVTMSLGNVLALLQNNVKRLLAYSSVAHAGYMLIGLAVAPKLAGVANGPVGGVEAVLFYLVSYSAMTIGVFAILHYLSTPGRPVEQIDDLEGLGRSQPGTALLMVLFLFSLIGIPLTAGFMGKVWLFFGALGVPVNEESRESLEQHRLFVLLALIGIVNAAIGGWYYLRIAAVMYLREPVQSLPKPRPAPVLATIWVCAVLTLAVGIYPTPLLRAVQSAVPRVSSTGSNQVAVEQPRVGLP
jgi:NADH-quinone oxidoreductase subunit N